MKKIVIIGMGLIGGSIGKTLLKKRIAREVIGVCRRKSSLERAIKERALTKGFINNYEKAVVGAEIIFIATPVDTTKKVLNALVKAVIDKKVIVTDVGSTKKEIVDYAARFKDKFSFVGAHPLAGSEKSGVEYSAADLFQNSVCMLTPVGGTSWKDLEKIKKLWKLMGARIEIISPEKHDRILSFTSHLPHIAAYTLAGAQKHEYLKYASTGFRDTVRIASSDPVLWGDIIMTNRYNVLRSIARFKRILSGLEKDIKQNKKASLVRKLEMYRRKKNGPLY